MTSGPIEPRGGQDDAAPDTRQAVVVSLLLMHDLFDHLRTREDDPEVRADLLLRLMSAIAVLRRVRARLDGAR
jgi:hypothetical protein